MRSFISIIVALVVIVGGVAIVYGYVMRPERVVQPIAFNHTVHLTEANLACTDCHSDARSHRTAGLPGKNMCFDCHEIDPEEVDNPQKAKLASFFEKDEDIPWQRVAVTRSDVFFSHRRHVTTAALDCLECHKDQTTLTAPPRHARLVMTMNDCIACHEQSQVSTDCLMCHR